jgi:two-component system chemotaxis response regulator CheB
MARARRREVIVMGGSAGAVDALATILPSLPADFSLPIATVVHLPPDRVSDLAGALSYRSAVRIKEAEDKEPLTPGCVFVAPPNYHLLLERSGHLSLAVDDPVHFSRPSIDVLFESAALAYGPRVLGILLTGANEDGASGLLAIHRAGGQTLVQSPESAVASAMPSSALLLEPRHDVLPLEEIGPFLLQLHRTGWEA